MALGSKTRRRVAQAGRRKSRRRAGRARVDRSEELQRTAKIQGAFGNENDVGSSGARYIDDIYADLCTISQGH